MPFKSNINWKNELDTIKELGRLGTNMTDLAKKYGVSKQRIQQVVYRYIPDWNTSYGVAAVRKQREQLYYDKWGKKEDTDLYNIQRHKFFRKKANAIRVGYDWSVSFGELSWPTHCPILGLELDYYAESRKESSPSFDRLDNTRGYEKGNVIVLSWRANRIKNDGTAEEHRKIAEFLDKRNNTGVASQV